MNKHIQIGLLCIFGLGLLSCGEAPLLSTGRGLGLTAIEDGTFIRETGLMQLSKLFGGAPSAEVIANEQRFSEVLREIEAAGEPIAVPSMAESDAAVEHALMNFEEPERIFQGIGTLAERDHWHRNRMIRTAAAAGILSFVGGAGVEYAADQYQTRSKQITCKDLVSRFQAADEQKDFDMAKTIRAQIEKECF